MKGVNLLVQRFRTLRVGDTTIYKLEILQIPATGGVIKDRDFNQLFNTNQYNTQVDRIDSRHMCGNRGRKYIGHPAPWVIKNNRREFQNTPLQQAE